MAGRKQPNPPPPKSMEDRLPLPNRSVTVEVETLAPGDKLEVPSDIKSEYELHFNRLIEADHLMQTAAAMKRVANKQLHDLLQRRIPGLVEHDYTATIEGWIHVGQKRDK